MAKDTKEKALAKLLAFKDDPKLATYEAINELSEKLGKLEGFSGIDLSKIEFLKGDKGEDGKSPIRGEDYMHDEDIAAIVDHLIDEVTPLIEELRPIKGYDYDDGEKGDKGDQGPPGKDGKNAPILSAGDIANKLNTLESVVERKVLKGFGAKDLFEEYAKLPQADKISWKNMFKEKGNPFQYYQVSSAGAGSVGGGSVLSVSSLNADLSITDPTINPVIEVIQSPALRSATTTIDVSAATAPSSGQVLTATSSTTATWQTPAAGGTDTYDRQTGITGTGVTLAGTPAAGRIPDVYRNGLLQQSGGIDYTLVGTALTFVVALVAADVVIIRYNV